MKQLNVWLCSMAIIAIFTGCSTTNGRSADEKRQAILAMKSEVLAELYKVDPQIESEVSSAPGYAVFSYVNVNVILANFGGGYGVVQNNKTGKQVFMKAGEAGIGVGLGATDFRAVFIFGDPPTFEKFTRRGWEFGGKADVAVKADGKGAAIGTEALLGKIKIYQLTQNGLVLQASLKGTRYWKDHELNLLRQVKFESKRVDPSSKTRMPVTTEVN